jgi:multidrug efflux system membrane fusion protein
MKQSYYIAALIALLAFVWILSGIIVPSSEDKNILPDEKASTELVSVRVRPMEAKEFSKEILVTGRTFASRKVELRSEIEGEVEQILVEKGARVEKGTVLANLDKRDRQARLEEAKQRLEQREIEFNAAKSLEIKGFNSKIRLAQAAADLEAARAELKKAQLDVDNTSITAPFAGVIDDQNIELGDFVEVGRYVYSVVDLDPIEVVGFLTEHQIMDVNREQAAVAELLDGSVVTGIVSYISPSANEQTRTFKVEVSVPNEDYKIIEGVTATLKIPTPVMKAHQISPSILSLNDDGQIGVKVVDAQDVVQFVPVEILSDTSDYMWVSGLPDRVLVITVGQEFVSEGQKIRPVPSSGDGLL